MATTPEKFQRRPGRPTRQEELRRALAEIGCDPALISPQRILASIAADTNAPASARVAACKALLAPRAPDGADGSSTSGDAVSVRAQQLLAARRRAN
jgi:hypothetical protein